LERHAGPGQVRIRPAQPVTWVDWKEGGGHGEFSQPRNLGSAILHQGKGERVLFVLNHAVDAVVYELAFAQKSIHRLVDLDTEEVVPVVKGRAAVDLDRKSCRVFRVA